MDSRLLIALLVAACSLVYYAVVAVRGGLRRARERRWAARHGWTDATATAAVDPKVLGTVKDPLEEDHPDRESYEDLRAAVASDEGPTLPSRTAVRRAWTNRVHGYPVLVVYSLTRHGRSIRQPQSHVFVTLPRHTPLLGIHPRYDGLRHEPPDELAFRSGDRRFDTRFVVFTEDQDFAARTITEPVREILLDGVDLLMHDNGIPGAVRFADGTLLSWELERRTLAESARIADWLVDVANGRTIVTDRG